MLDLEKYCSNFDNEKKRLESQLRAVEEKLNAETEKSKQLTDIVAQKEMELNEVRVILCAFRYCCFYCMCFKNKNVLTSARKEVVQSKKAVEVCQQEFASLKSESSLLQVQVAEKHKKITELEAQKKRLLADIESHKKNEVKQTGFSTFYF